ncbi:MAG: high-potential iron-sulfur protein [Chitinophagaceae bacterium]|nr:high-potential iron-sulfur protein [Chitinophagaceae bacterium]
MAVMAGITISGIGCDEKKPDNETPVDNNPCSHLSGLSESDLDARKKFNYADKSPDKNKTCVTCNLYIPGKENAQCGSCMLFKGPVMAAGTCIYWTPAT